MTFDRLTALGPVWADAFFVAHRVRDRHLGPTQVEAMVLPPERCSSAFRCKAWKSVVPHQVVHSYALPTAHRRIQVTEDPELARALRSAAPFLPSGLSRAGQVRELALAGARQLAARDPGSADRAALLRRLADRFRDPASAGIDWDALRDGKRRAWRTD